MNLIWFFTSALTLLCVVGLGTSLKCYSCRVIEGITNNNNPCQSPVECNGICLSSTFTLENTIENKKITGTVKTCVRKTDGRECEKISQLDNLMNFPGFKADFGGKCYTCETDGCNRCSGSTKVSMALFLTLSIASLLWCIVNRS